MSEVCVEKCVIVDFKLRQFQLWVFQILMLALGSSTGINCSSAARGNTKCGVAFLQAFTVC